MPSRLHATDPWFYFRYDLVWAAGLALAVAGLLGAGWAGFGPTPTDAALLLAPACYLMVLAHVVVHNAAHQNLPPLVNALVGELLGAVVLTRFASWEILHQRHHRFPDDEDRDPHPVEPSFVGFLVRRMLLNLERNLHQQYFERFGDTPAHRRRERARSAVSFGTMLLLLLFWHTLLGAAAFWLVFLPAAGFALLFVAHFNWVTHDAKNPSGRHGPVDLDHGLYGALNRVLFGLYLHASHHADPSRFHPGRGPRP